MGLAPKTLTERLSADMNKILASLDEDIPLVEAPEFANLVNYSSQANEPIHRWFRYREGYSTELVRYLLKDMKAGSLIVDPFCGAGTTLLASRNLGLRSIGIDANPLSTFVARTKTRNYSPAELQRFGDICQRVRDLSPNYQHAAKPQLEIIDKVFLPEVLRTLLIIKHFIESELTAVDRDFFFLAWLSILEQVSNVFKEGNGIKYRTRKRTPTGYVDIPIDVWQTSMFPQDKFEHVITTFLNRVKLMVDDVRGIEAFGPDPEVIEGDALSLHEYVPPESVSLVAFSPPYANNFNYFKAYKVELWMGGFVNSYDDIKELTRRSLRSHVETRLTKESDALNSYPKELDLLLALVDTETLWTPRIPQAVRGYFYDMRRVLEGVYTSLEAGGQCVAVVGNSAYGSVVVPTDSLLAKIASRVGFQVERIAVARHLTTSSQQKIALEPFRKYLRESLLFLRKPRVVNGWPTASDGVRGYRNVTTLPKYPRPAEAEIYVIRNQGLTDVTHIMHKYPGRFIPHVPRWALEKYLGKGSNQIVLDPFCGSGTSLVEACLAGHTAFGIDIDPLARLISKVKTTPIDPLALTRAVFEVSSQVRARVESHFRPPIETLAHWFAPDTSQDLGVIRESIEPWRDIDRDIYDFFIVAYSSIIRKVSRADNQSLKTYVSGTHKKNPLEAKPLFVSTLNEYAGRILQLGEQIKGGGHAVVLDVEDARSFARAWEMLGCPPVDLAITSPPYIKSIDYIYNQMAEYFWIGDLFELNTQSKQNAAKRQYIGTEKVSAGEYSRNDPLGIAEIDDLAAQIRTLDPKHSYIFYKYFADMASHFRQMKQVLRPDGVYVVVIGDSTISDFQVPTHKLLALVAQAVGFSVTGEFAYEIRNRYMRFPRKGRGGIVDLDWVLTFTR